MYSRAASFGNSQIVSTCFGMSRLARFRTQVEDTYTMKWETLHGTFGKLLLVDNITGVTTDMTVYDQYTFPGSANDYANRFYLVFTVTGVEEEFDVTNDSFAFFNGSEWVVFGEGQLDLIDMTGRTLYSKYLPGEQNNVSLDGFAAGVYVLRFGDKTQKIVIK